MDLECVESMEQTYSKLASVIIDGVQSGKEQMMSGWLNRLHWYRRYPNSYPRYAVTPVSDSIIIFVSKYTFIIPLPRFLVDRNTRKWLNERNR